MKVIIPTAGSSTRLRPHTFAIPKTLIQVAGHPILDYLLQPLVEIPDLSELIFIVGNGQIREGVSSSGIVRRGASPAVRWSVRSGRGITSSQADSRRGRHAVGYGIGQSRRVWKFYLWSFVAGGVCGLVGSSGGVCGGYAGGSLRICQPTMPKQSWQNGARLQGIRKRSGRFFLEIFSSESVAALFACESGWNGGGERNKLVLCHHHYP